ncbi:unnamed protein product [Ceratitis capitata]|uniref:(Mediterranean fruit fly) hypothetical protein n=1 Tax=Ceratitis capitata TaxID=7213 RepID=A0A811V093_CERCA|nr:unnamed protein product [Ceratitis capitata]
MATDWKEVKRSSSAHHLELPIVVLKNYRHTLKPFVESAKCSFVKYTSSLETTAENASESNIGAETNFTSILVEDKNNYNVNLFAIDENSSKESPTFVELQTATKEDIDDYTEFIAINENDEDLKFLRNG